MNNFEQALQTVFAGTFNFRTVLVFVIALCAAYILSQLLAFCIIKITHIVGQYGDAAKTPEKMLRLRRAETYLSVTIAFTRVAVFVLAVIFAWIYTHPDGSGPITVLGASTIFIVLAGATLTPTLRDITAGSLMILEKWYNVGDFITIDPYYEERGVVERINLRSTRIRKMNGEVTWIHNQYIQRVAVAQKGTRTLAIDLFVDDVKKGERLVERLKKVMRVDPTMLAAPLEVTDKRQLDDDLWEMTVMGETPPGREWLFEQFAVDMLKRYDDQLFDGKSTLASEPLVRYADETAARRFKRAIQLKPQAAANLAKAEKAQEKQDGKRLSLKK